MAYDAAMWMVQGHGRLSSSFTFLEKFVLPTIWLGACGLGVVASLMGLLPASIANTPLLIAGLVAGALAFGRWGIPLKKVVMTGDGLLVSNYLREVVVPYELIEGVSENKLLNLRPITVHLSERTAFGRGFSFIPRAAFVAFWREHPAAKVLLDRAAAAQQAKAHASKGKEAPGAT